ncbi:MAG: S16 family serine protease [Pirellulales bacterium]
MQRNGLQHLRAGARYAPLMAMACALIAAGWLRAAEAQEQPAAGPRTVVVNVVAFSTAADGTAAGSCSPVRVTAGENEGGAVRVGFFESEVSGTGAMWRSAGWTAAVTAAVLSDFNPRCARVSFEYEGRVDGPSAGALMTVGVLAAVRGDPLRTDAAMTGTINPDGSIGPVGGIVHKIDGAAAQGMKLMLIPAGIRFDRDANSDEQVDLVEHGAAKGAEVRPVFDIYTAYELLSGVPLPRPPATAAPRVGLAAQQRVQEKMGEWYKHYETSLSSYTKLQGTAKLSQEVIDLYQKGVEILAHSNELKNEGEFSAALWDRVRAAAFGYLALEAGRCRHTYAAQGYEGLIARLRDNGWLQEDVKQTAARLRAEPPKTLDQLSMYLSACDAFLEAVSMQLMARSTLADLSDEESQEDLLLAADAAEKQILAWIDLKLTRDYLDLAAAYAGPPIPQEAPWRQTGDYLRRASQANLAVFDALVIDPGAKTDEVSADDYRAALMRQDFSYGILQSANENAFPRLGEYFGEGDTLGYAYLGSSMYTYIRAAGLLAKYYSLGAELNENKQIVRLPRERTLGEWLTYAEDQSRRGIAQLQSRNIDATPAAQMHEIARIKARRGLDEKVEGLIGFWQADLHAQVLRRISGAAAPAEPPKP